MVVEGDKLPNVTFKFRIRNNKKIDNPFEWKDITTEDLFKNKRVVLFALPGAFTPTCSSRHLPGYEEHYDELIKLGVDDVYCLSVNDAFVMRQWGLHQGLEEDMTVSDNNLVFKKVKLLPDGACLFTKAMGMMSDWTSLRGFGKRSWSFYGARGRL